MSKQKKKFKFGSLIWKPREVLTASLKSTPDNYKIKTDIGRERLQSSLGEFGLAGTCIVVQLTAAFKGIKPNDLVIVDGNSRHVEALEQGLKKLWVSMPQRKLTPKEFQEMSAMYDFAKAGEVDLERIEKELGTSVDFYDKYKMNVPMHLLDNMGAKAKLVRDLEFPADAEKELEGRQMTDIHQVQLLFTGKQLEQFRRMEDVLKEQFKTKAVTDTVLRSFKELTNKKRKA